VPFAEALEMPEDAELADISQGYWLAWHLLSSERQLGAMGGAGRIPFGSIDRYASQNLFDDEIVLSRMLWAMDDVYLEWMAEKQKTADGK
jgi:hypothetical protein